MSDVNYTLRGTLRRNTNVVLANGDAGNVKSVVATRSVTARTANDTLQMIRIPSNARISGRSQIHWDDLASTGSPTIDIGLAPVNDAANLITADPDALNDGLDVATAAGSAALIKDHANYGKRAWEFINGLTQDPGTLLDIYVSFVDANTNTTGDVTVELFYTLD